MNNTAMLPPVLLLPDELFAITGYRRATDQAAAIRDRYGIHAYVNKLGEAVVVRAHLEGAQRPLQNERPRKEIKSRRAA